MVKTRVELKSKLKEWIEQRQTPFTTQEAKDEMSKVATNIFLSPNRLTKYIKATAAADYDPKHRNWKVNLRPFKKIKSGD